MGLCAQAWRRKTDLAGAACTHQTNASAPPAIAQGDRTHPEILLHALKVESDRLLVVVRVALDLESRILHDRDVVAPGRSREVDGLGVGVEALEERSSDAKSSSARDGLSDGDLKESGVSRAVDRGCSRGRTRPSLRGAESAPYARIAACLVNSGNPVMGRYSLSFFWATMSSSAYASPEGEESPVSC